MRIETSVEAGAPGNLAELYETVPVFLGETATQPAPAIRFLTGGEWIDATPAPRANVHSVSIDRGQGQVRIAFARPVTACLSPTVWQDGFQTQARCRTVLIDLLPRDDPAARGFSVTCTICSETDAGASPIKLK